MMNDVILNKAAVIERCVNRIKEVYADQPENLKDFTLQDSIILNLQRACEASIDLAMHLISVKRLGIPKVSRDAFILLEQNKLLEPDLSKNLQAMLDFLSVAVRDDQAVNISTLQSIIENHLRDFLEFTQMVLKKDI